MSRRNSVLSDITQQQTNQLLQQQGGAPLHCRPTSATTTPVISPVVSRPASPVEIDLRYVPQYCDEIVEHMMQRERLLPRDGTFLENQPEVTERMRQILVDWLIDVHLKFKLHPETYFLSVDIVDRYLGLKWVTRAQLQLVGITAVLIAAKHEEIWPPEVKDCVYISANTYTAAEVLSMEREIAAQLRFRFTVPTPYPFVCRLLDATNAPESVRHASMFFLDASTHLYLLAGFLPSYVACASVLLARWLIASNSITMAESEAQHPSVYWDRELAVVSHGVSYSELEQIVTELLAGTQALTTASSRLQAVRRKYLSHRFGAVAALNFPAMPNAPVA